jgi:cysteine desulfurase
MAKALELWHANQEDRIARTTSLRDRLQAGLVSRCAPVTINGSQEHRLPNTLNISFPGLDGEALLVALDLEGVACSLGSTCASGSAEPAPSLVAMGLGEDVYRSAVRFSVAFDNTEAEIAQAIERIAQVVNRLRA